MNVRVSPLLWLTLLGVLAAPRGAHGSWLDIIWEMTGPRLYGIGIDCELGPGGNACVIFPGFPLGTRDTRRPVWFTLEARGYFWDADDDNQFSFDALQFRMIA